MRISERIREAARRAAQSKLNTQKLDRSLKNKISKDLDKAGLDGNGRFGKPQYGLTKAMEVLSKHGIEQDQVTSADLFRGPKRSFTVHLAFSNPEDPFSPVPISNSMLAFSYTKLNGNYECLAYLS